MKYCRRKSKFSWIALKTFFIINPQKSDAVRLVGISGSLPKRKHFHETLSYFVSMIDNISITQKSGICRFFPYFLLLHAFFGG